MTPRRQDPLGPRAELLAVAVILLALTFPDVRTPSLSIEGWVVVAIAILVLNFVSIIGLTLRDASCPNCGDGVLGRVAVVPFGELFRCSLCGTFWRPKFPEGWAQVKDASSLARCQRRAKEGRWADPPIPVSEDGPVGGLLRGKWSRESRRPTLPDGCDLMAGDPAYHAPKADDILPPSDSLETSRRLLLGKWLRQSHGRGVALSKPAAAELRDEL